MPLPCILRKNTREETAIFIPNLKPFQLTFPALDGIIYEEIFGFPAIYILRQKRL